MKIIKLNNNVEENGRWEDIPNGGQIFNGADAGEFPDYPTGDQVGSCEKSTVFENGVDFYTSEDENYTYITHIFPSFFGSTGLVLRFKK